MRQMTFDIPDEVAEDFINDVPEAERSDLVASLILHRRDKKAYTEAEWAAAAEAANSDEVLTRETEEWQAFSDSIEEPWDASSPR